jgi:hypothetical protein
VSYSFTPGARLRIHIVSTRDRKPGFLMVSAGVRPRRRLTVEEVVAQDIADRKAERQEIARLLGSGEAMTEDSGIALATS